MLLEQVRARVVSHPISMIYLRLRLQYCRLSRFKRGMERDPSWLKWREKTDKKKQYVLHASPCIDGWMHRRRPSQPFVIIIKKKNLNERTVNNIDCFFPNWRSWMDVKDLHLVFKMTRNPSNFHPQTYPGDSSLPCVADACKYFNFKKLISLSLSMHLGLW